MTGLTDHIRNRDDLRIDAAVMTVVFLLLVYVLLQLFGYDRPLAAAEEIVRIELAELRPVVKSTPERAQPRARTAAGKPTTVPTPKRAEKTTPERAKPRTQAADISSLVQSFTLSRKTTPTNAARRSRTTSEATVTSLSTTLSSSTESTPAESELNLKLSRRKNAISAGRRGAPAASESASVSLGGASSAVGSVSGVVAGLAGGNGQERATRSTGGTGGSANISIPLGDGEGEATTINLLDLIKWMKANPGTIPLLVGHEMQHTRRVDLASAVTFAMQGRQYTIYLSCNEKELLLRICLIENNAFTLLKDNGISERSNFLTTGGVMRDNGAINSLISSRQAPQNRAAVFYTIFWNWWEQERDRT